MSISAYQPSSSGTDGSESAEFAAVAKAHLPRVETILLETLEQVDELQAKVHNLERALQNSRDIGTAMGVLMALRKVTREEAFQLLRQVSSHQNRKLYLVALDVLETGDLPD